jgi:hypothetical protein
MGAGRLVAVSGGGDLLRLLAQGSATVLLWVPVGLPLLKTIGAARR